MSSVELRSVAAPAPGGARHRDGLFAHADRLFVLAVRLLGNTADAEDVVHDVFVRALAAFDRGTFREDSALLTWLYRCTTNLALDRRRSSARSAALPRPTEEVASATSPEQARLLSELSEALDLLPDDQRAALVLKELQGLTTKEVGDVLNRSVGAVEQLLVRARTTLRGRFER